MNNLKIAIFHNYMDNIGGAEHVTIALAKQLKADIYTTNIDREKIDKMGGKDLRIYSIGKIPINAPFRQQIAMARFRYLDLSGKYDYYIIAGDWAVSAAVNHKPNIWYVHSPIREIWDLYHYTRKNIVSVFKRPVFDIWVLLNRFLSRRYIKHVEKLLCNSKNTQSRVLKYLNRTAKVLPPPTETKDYFYKDHKGYWLSVNRLISHKQIEIQMDTFRQLPDEKLIVVGCYEKSDHFQSYANKIISAAPSNVEFRSWVDRDELIKLYAHCKGVISTAVDEDFGLTAVEAMASGKPMIAPKIGGYCETVEHLKSGVLMEYVSSVHLTGAINEANMRLKDFIQPSLDRAKLFDIVPFIDGIKSEMF